MCSHDRPCAAATIFLPAAPASCPVNPEHTPISTPTHSIAREYGQYPQQGPRHLREGEGKLHKGPPSLSWDQRVRPCYISLFCISSSLYLSSPSIILSSRFHFPSNYPPLETPFETFFSASFNSANLPAIRVNSAPRRQTEFGVLACNAWTVFEVMFVPSLYFYEAFRLCV